MAVRLLLLKLLTNRLSTADYGTYAFWTASAAMGTILFGAELYRYLQRQVRDLPNAESWLRSQLIGETALILAVGLIVAGVAVTAVGGAIGLPRGAWIPLLTMLVWSELMIVELVRFAVLRGRGALGEGAKLVRSLVTVGIVVALPSLSTFGALAAVCGANLVAVLMLARVPMRRTETGAVTRTRILSQLGVMVSHAGVFLIPALANQLLKVGDRFFVYGALSAEELARYSVAYNLQLLCFGATGGLASSLIYPLVLRDTAADPARGHARWLWLQIGIQVIASAILFIVSGPLVGLVSSSAYGDAVPLVRALTPLPVLMVLSGAMLMRFLATGRRRAYAVATVAGAVIAVALYAVLVPRQGVAGAVNGTLAGYASTAMLAWWLGRNHSSAPQQGTA